MGMKHDNSGDDFTILLDLVLYTCPEERWLHPEIAVVSRVQG